MAADWTAFITPMLRDMIGDTASPYDFSDVDLQRKILVAINLMQIEIDFTISYAADIVGLTLNPDPYTYSTPDYDFMSLAAMKAACLIERSQATKTTSGDVQLIQDNDFTIKTGNVGANKLAAIKVNWCAAYEAAKNDFITSIGAQNYGRAVISPFRYSYITEGTRSGSRSRMNWEAGWG